MRSGGHPLARWPVAGAGTCPPCAGCCGAPWPAWPARWRGRTHRLPPQLHPKQPATRPLHPPTPAQAAGRASPACMPHAAKGCTSCSAARTKRPRPARPPRCHRRPGCRSRCPTAGSARAAGRVTMARCGTAWTGATAAPLPHRPAWRWPPTASTWQASCGWATPCCGATATWPSPCRAAGRTPASAWACAVQARMQRVGGELQVQSAPGATVLTVHLMPAQAPESQPAPLLLNMNQNRIWRASSLRKQLLS